MATGLRFYLDEHIPLAVLTAMRRRGIDVVRPQEIGREGIGDLAQLEWANTESRVIVSFDDDFLRLAARGVEHSGIVYCPADKYGIGELLNLLVLIYDVADPVQMRNHVEFI